MTADDQDRQDGENGQYDARDKDDDGKDLLAKTRSDSLFLYGREEEDAEEEEEEEE